MNEASATAQVKPELPTVGRTRPEPGAYYLDLEGVATFPVKFNGEPSTFVVAYRKLLEAKVLKVSDGFSMYEEKFETEAGDVTVSVESETHIEGQAFLLRVLRNLLDLEKDGIRPDLATWFYYDHDWSRDADELYVFFLVYEGKIVRERYSFIHCDPRILTKHKVDDEPIWHSEPYHQAAWEGYWYRKFYTETLTGQLMVMRPDEPILYRFDRATHDVTKDVQFVTLIKSYRLLWIVAVLITSIAFPLLKPYLAIVAGVLFVDLLWRAWVSRKVGQ